MSGAIVDAHCHLWVAPRATGAIRLVDEPLAEAELRAFADAGGTAVIDCQPGGGAGRDGRMLARLATATGIEIAPATGFHMPMYYPQGESPYEADPDTLADAWTAELAEGLVEEPAIRARVVKSAWTGTEDAIITAAAEAARLGGGALIVHTERGAEAERLAEVLLQTTLPPERVQISHLDKRPDEALHLELARAGFTLGYDAFLRPRYRPDETTWPLLRALVAAGLQERVTVGLDIVDPALWSVRGGAGLPWISRSIRPRLAGEVGEEAAAAISGLNAIRLLERAGVSA